MRLLFDSYLQAIQYHNFNSLPIKNIYLKNYTFINFQKPIHQDPFKSFYIIQEFQPDLSDVLFETCKNNVNDSDIINVNSLKDLIDIIKNSQYIACDDEYTSLVAYILNIKYDENFFTQTYEGNIWKLLRAFKYPFETEILKKLEISQEYKITNHSYPFMEYSPQSNNALFLKYKKLIQEKKYKELYEIFNKKCNFLIDIDKLEKIYYISYNQQNNIKLIDKSLAQNYLNVTYIGKNNIQCKIKINYSTKNNNLIFPFSDINDNFESNDLHELNLLNLKKFGKLKQKQLNVFEEKHDIYYEVLKECKKTIQNPSNLKWQKDLYYSGIEYRKILVKSKLIINKYFETIKQFDNIKIEHQHSRSSFQYDFYFTYQNQIYCIDLCWNLPSKQEIYTNLKYKNTDIIFYLISTECYIVDQNNFNNYKINENPEYNDLFYWRNTCLTT